MHKPEGFISKTSEKIDLEAERISLAVLEIITDIENYCRENHAVNPFAMVAEELWARAELERDDDEEEMAFVLDVLADIYDRTGGSDRLTVEDGLHFAISNGPKITTLQKMIFERLQGNKLGERLRQLE